MTIQIINNLEALSSVRGKLNSNFSELYGLPTAKSFALTTQGIGTGEFYSAGFYKSQSADANLTNASPSVTFGEALHAYSAHAFIVAGGAGVTDGSDLILTVTGTSITDAGVRTAGDSQVIVLDGTLSSLNEYLETSKKWAGTITFTLSSTGGTTFNYDFNFGFAKYEDFGNRDFTLIGFEVTGLAGANDSAFNIQLLHHKATGWTYSAASFVAGDGSIVDSRTDLGAEGNLVNGEDIAYKRTGLSQAIQGSASEGIIIQTTTGTNNSVEILNMHVGVSI